MDDDEVKEYSGILANMPRHLRDIEKVGIEKTVEEAYDGKWKLEEDILALVTKYEEEFGLRVMSVSFTRDDGPLAGAVAEISL